MKAIIYIRTSTVEQHPENQINDCLKLVQGDYEIIEEKQSAFKDRGRVLFEQLKNRIKLGEVNSVICWDWDRLFRNRLKLKEFFQFCKIYNCEVHSYRQKFFEDFYKIPKPFDDIVQELVLNLLGWLAEDESRKKSDRVKIAYQNKKGDWGRKELNQSVQEEIIKLYNQGKTLRQIKEQVYYWDKNRNQRNVSIGYVHKIIKEIKG